MMISEFKTTSENLKQSRARSPETSGNTAKPSVEGTYLPLFRGGGPHIILHGEPNTQGLSSSWGGARCFSTEPLGSRTEQKLSDHKGGLV